MTSLMEGKPREAPTRGESKTEFRLPVTPRGRRPLVAVVSALLVFTSVAVFASVYSSANHQTPALIVVQTIQEGQRISGTDLGQASVAISAGVSPIPVSSAPLLAGKRAAVTIPAGSLLTLADVAGSAPIAAGEAVVGMALKDGEYPSAGVESGDQVMIVQSASPGAPATASASATATDTGSGSGSGSQNAGGSASGVLVPQATVFDVGAPSANSSSGASLLVSVEVSTTLAAEVSNAASAGEVSLVLLPQGSGDQLGGAPVSGAPVGGAK
jgi:hypothetical protein